MLFVVVVVVGRYLNMTRRKTSPEELHADRLKKKRQRDVKLDRNILNLQNQDIPLIPKLPFSRLVREIMGQEKTNYRITAVALVEYRSKFGKFFRNSENHIVLQAALQEACEFYLTYLFSDAYLLTYHRKRVTLDRSDIRMVLHIRATTQRWIVYECVFLEICNVRIVILSLSLRRYVWKIYICVDTLLPAIETLNWNSKS